MAETKTKSNNSVKIKKGSWLKNCRLANLDDGVVAWAGLKIPRFPERDGDLEYRVKGQDRPETVAANFYGHGSLWWVIAVANELRVPLVDFYPGRVLRIPEPNEVLRRISSKGEV